MRVPGLTPVILRQVKADREHTLRAKRSGRPDWVTTFRVGAGERIRLEGSFE